MVKWQCKVDRNTQRGRLVAWLDAHARPFLFSLIAVDLALTWSAYVNIIPGRTAAIAQTLIGVLAVLELLIVFDYIVFLSATGSMSMEASAEMTVHRGDDGESAGEDDGE